MNRGEPLEWDEFHDPEIVDWKRIRSAIEHENTLINHRFTWLLTSQAFLASAFFYIWEASSSSTPPAVGRLPLHLVLLTIVLTGLFTSAHLTLGLRSAHLQHDVLRDWWRKRPKTMGRHPEICGSHPLLPYYYFALIFTFAWLVLGVIGFIDFIQPYTNAIALTISAIAILCVGLLGGRILGRRARSKDTDPTLLNVT